MHSTIERIKRHTYIAISGIGLAGLLVSTFAGTFPLSIEGDLVVFDTFSRFVLICVFAFTIWVFSTQIISFSLGEHIFISGISAMYLFRFVVLLFTRTEWGALHEATIDALSYFPAVSALVFFAYNFQYALLFCVTLYCIVSFLILPASFQLDELRFEPVLMFELIGHQLHALVLFVIIAMLGRSKEQWIHFHSEARRMKRLAFLDPLTQVANRRGLSTVLNEALQSNATPLTVVLFDIDSFKNINDQFGHLIGDAVLVATANVVKSMLRADDTFGRWGGEEFLVVCKNTTLQEGLKMAERLRDAISSHPFQRVGVVTASFGVVERLPNETAEALLLRADRMLYKAKAEGKNRVEHGVAPTSVSE